MKKRIWWGVPEIRVHLGKDKERVFDPEKLTSIDTETMIDEMSVQPSLYARISVLASLAHTQRDEAKQRYDIYRKTLYLELRKTKKTTHITDDEIRAVAVADKEAQDLWRKFKDEDLQYRLLESVRESLSQRKDMLQSINARQRAEEGGVY